jgi:hypothetical protein
VNREQTAQLLGAMAAFDRRTVGRADVIAWHEMLADVQYADALEGVKRWYAEHRDMIWVADLLEILRNIAREREAAARATGWAPGQAGVPKDQAMPEVTDGRSSGWLADAIERATSDSASAILAEIRRNLPEGSREALRPRAVYWEQRHRAYQRSAGAEPNPYYRPTAADTATTTGDVLTDLCACRGNDLIHLHPRGSDGCIS